MPQVSRAIPKDLEEDEVWIRRSDVPTERLPAMSLRTQRERLVTREKDGSLFMWAMVRGRIHDPRVNLIYKDKHLLKALRPSDPGFKDPKPREFQFYVPIIAAQTRITLVSVGVLGETRAEELVLEFPNLAQYLNDWKERKNLPRLGVLSPSLGVTYVSYAETDTTETAIAKLTQIALTGKVGYQRHLPIKGFDVGASTFVTLLPISVSEVMTDEGLKKLPIRFWGLNVRLGYKIPQVTGRWSLMMFGGFYYTTTFVDENEFGFKDMRGPQAFPVWSYQLQNNQSLSGYLKFAPIFRTGGTSYEIASGVGWAKKLPNRRSFTVNLDVSNFTLKFVPENVQMRTTSVSLSVGMTFSK